MIINLLDQLSKTVFFHQKLHEWLWVAGQIDQVEGEKLAWNQPDLAISSKAWQKVIHRGIKPVIVFAHPQILQTIARSISYYRMLAMVSQKSMNQVGLSTKQYEDGFAPDEPTAQAIANHLNNIISTLIERHERLDRQIFDLWRGMAIGSEAQCFWPNSYRLNNGHDSTCYPPGD